MIKFYLSNIKFIFFSSIYWDHDETLIKCSDIIIIIKGPRNNDYKARLYSRYKLSEGHNVLLSNNIFQEEPDFSKSSNLEKYGLHIFLNEEELFYLKLKYSNDFY